MTRKDRKRYSREFKLEAVRRANESGELVTEVARELDISVHHLYRWCDEAAKQGEKVFPGKGKTNSQDELTRLSFRACHKINKEEFKKKRGWGTDRFVKIFLDINTSPLHLTWASSRMG